MRPVLWLLTAGIALAACGERPEPPSAVGPPVTEADLLSRGREITSKAFALLSENLLEAMEEGGPAHAISFCSEQAIALTAGVGEEMGVGLRRVSHKARNPLNLADEREREILRGFGADLGTGRPLLPVLLRNPDGSATYFAPIVLNNDVCLSCHGQPGSEIDSAILDVLRRRYPSDQATGFRRGDLRGMWRVDFGPP